MTFWSSAGELFVRLIARPRDAKDSKKGVFGQVLTVAGAGFAEDIAAKNGQREIADAAQLLRDHTARRLEAETKKIEAEAAGAELDNEIKRAQYFKTIAEAKAIQIADAERAAATEAQTARANLSRLSDALEVFSLFNGRLMADRQRLLEMLEQRPRAIEAHLDQEVPLSIKAEATAGEPLNADAAAQGEPTAGAGPIPVGPDPRQKQVSAVFEAHVQARAGIEAVLSTGAAKTPVVATPGPADLSFGGSAPNAFISGSPDEVVDRVPASITITPLPNTEVERGHSGGSPNTTAVGSMAINMPGVAGSGVVTNDGETVVTQSGDQIITRQTP